MSWSDMEPEAVDIMLQGWIIWKGNKVAFCIDKIPGERVEYRATVGDLFASKKVARGLNLGDVVRELYRVSDR